MKKKILPKKSKTKAHVAKKKPAKTAASRSAASKVLTPKGKPAKRVTKPKAKARKPAKVARSHRWMTVVQDYIVRKRPARTTARTEAGSQAGWIFGMVGTPLLIALALWRSSLPPEVPGPTNLQAQVSAPQEQRAPAAAPPAPPPVPAAPPAPPAPAVSPPAPPAPVPPQAVAPAPARATNGLTPYFDEAAGRKEIGERIVYWSERLLTEEKKVREILKGVVRAPGIQDSAPLVPEKFDCTTYVETVLSLSRSQDSEQFVPQLFSIRYREGKTDYLHRNHFPEADWIANNSKSGVLKDVTLAIAGAAGVKHQIESKTIDRGAWLKLQKVPEGDRAARTIASAPDLDPYYAKPVHVSVPYVSVDDIEKVAKKIPTGTVLNLVRRNRRDIDVVITHQGFVIQKPEGTFLRHSLPDGQILEKDLAQYLRTHRARAAAKSPVLGVNLNQVADRSAS